MKREHVDGMSSVCKIENSPAKDQARFRIRKIIGITEITENREHLRNGWIEIKCRPLLMNC
jgi:hypothetical protein